MFNKNLLTSLLLLTVIAGCDSDDKGEDTSPSLIGVWNSSCIADESDPDDEESSITSFEFTGAEVIITEQIYFDLACENTLIELTASGTYTIGESVLTPTGVDATEVDFNLTEASNSFGYENEDYNFTFLDLFVIEDTYLYFGNNWGDGSDDESEEQIRPEDIDYTFSFELQE